MAFVRRWAAILALFLAVLPVTASAEMISPYGISGTKEAAAVDWRESDPAVETVTAEAPVAEVSMDWHTYSVGRCVIPDLVDMAMAACDIREAAGWINANYAARFADPYYPSTQDVIGAHCDTSFGYMRFSVPGETIAYLDGAAYVCAANFRGVNDHRLYDADGNLIDWNGPVMYTCNGTNYHDVTITYWTPID